MRFRRIHKLISALIIALFVQQYSVNAQAADQASAQWLTKFQKGYGYGYYPLNINNGRHYGVDIFMNTGTPIKAISSGKIAYA